MILGISSYYHDSAAAIVGKNGIIAAAQEERFTRIKHDYNFPIHAINYCLKEADISVEELDQIVFYEKPLLKFDRLLETYIGFAPVGLQSFVKAMPQWLKQKLHLPREIKKICPENGTSRLSSHPIMSPMQPVLFFPALLKKLPSSQWMESVNGIRSP